MLHYSASYMYYSKYLPYTFTVATLETTDLFSLLTLHLYMYCPTGSDVLVVYDVVLSLLTVIHLLSLKLISQENIGVPKPLALHIKV